eukprot:3578303-Pyramimonas_sp.AAC.1
MQDVDAAIAQFVRCADQRLWHSARDHRQSARRLRRQRPQCASATARGEPSAATLEQPSSTVYLSA